MNDLKSFPIEKVLIGTQKLNIVDLYNYTKLNKSETMEKIKEKIEMVYRIKAGNVLLLAPNSEFVRIVKKDYDQYFMSVSFYIIDIKINGFWS